MLFTAAFPDWLHIQLPETILLRSPRAPMFKRPASVKNLSVLRSSDRKKIIQQVSQSFSLETLDSDAKNSLLPEGAQVYIPADHCLLLLLTDIVL